MLSAAFCVGGYGVSDAYTYSGVTSTVDKVLEDKNVFIVTDKANITSTVDISPKLIEKSMQSKTIQCDAITLSFTQHNGDDLDEYGWEISNIPGALSDSQANELVSIIKSMTKSNRSQLLSDYNQKYGTNIKFTTGYDGTVYEDGSYNYLGELIGSDYVSYENGKWKGYGEDEQHSGTAQYNWDWLRPYTDGTTQVTTSQEVTNVLGDSSITVSNSSSLISNGNVQTSKFINISGTSQLNAYGGIITGGDISVTDHSQLMAYNQETGATYKETINADSIVTDGDILAGLENSGWLPEGWFATYGDNPSLVFAVNINTKGLLKTTGGGIGAHSDFGSISAGSIESAGAVATINGNFEGSKITAGGKVKGKSLSVGKVNAATTSISGNATFSGSTTLKGGASANSKKVSSVAKGTENTDLINLGQMNTAFAGGGKTYTAGGNIAINSSNNAISVVKNGAVKSGDAGIVTGATVFDITSGLESSLTLQDTRLTNLSSSIGAKETGFGTINTSVNGLQSNVNSAIASLNTKAKSYLRNDFQNITDEGRTKLSSLITASIKNYKDNLSGVATTTSDDTSNSQIATLENLTTPTVSARDSGVGNTVVTGAIEQGNTDVVTGGDIYTALDTKADTDTVNSILNEKVSVSDFAPVKEMVNQNKEDIAGLEDSKADISSFNTAMEGKIDKSDFDTLHSQAMVNHEDITSLISSKLNADGSNLDVSTYSTKLANGILDKQNKGLVTGGMVYNALRFTADKDYVDAMGEGLSHTLQETAYFLNKDMNKMAAGAAALAGLHPQDYTEDCKVDFATGYGHYKDANAVAVGLFYHPNPIATVSLSGTMGNGSPMVNAGLSFKFGYGKHVEKAVINKADYEALQGQVVKLKQMVRNLSE